MSASSPELGEPRWYADPAGGAGLRWWDGTQWTTAVMGPAELGPPVQQPLPPETPVFTVSLWIIVFLPLLATAAVMVMPGAPLSSVFDMQASRQLSTFDSAELIRNLLSLAIYGTTVALAFADRRALLRAGYQRPFHWAWAFLSTGVYVVGRSVIVQRRIGRGLTPIWVWVGVTMLGLVVSVSSLLR
ncbi:DUF2510 domain-containing protein [Cryobacterium sp. SO2]|uniref:DUF2510 domain-containing protein n=1 Tax=Cryobacterium sp. SO2 TaxID=1897060 RepID=UPI00223D6B25|nr:DUF2510 domain-containing protein [Cryobacterium sp. SO2]WEO76294.1 DUF2510 domain-containing protein [Cryobacterium sp. SO2]